MTAIFRAPARAHLYATLTQLLQLPGKQGRAADNAAAPFDAQAEGRDVFDCGLRDDGTPRIELQRLDNSPAGPRCSAATRMPGSTSFATRAQGRSRINVPCKWSIRSNGSPSKRNAAGARALSPRDQQNPTSFGGIV